jgi:hypothetical protein
MRPIKRLEGVPIRFFYSNFLDLTYTTVYHTEVIRDDIGTY